MLSISATDEWRISHSGAIIGLLEVSGAANTRPSPSLDARKRETEARLRARYVGFTRQNFLALPVLADYERYYKRFNKTYHVQLQVESIVLKGKDLPDVSPLVDANFIAEVETLVLTAGHDVAKLRTPIVIDVSREGDQMTQMNGTLKDIRAGDMIMKDNGGVCCSIIYGQDDRSPISAETSHVLYVAYAPAGVPAERVDAQLLGIADNIRLFSPSAVVEQCRLLTAGSGG
jgi:DNA/RNA-binding domain of Phe-tRNA-synthetase-like protein